MIVAMLGKEGRVPNTLIDPTSGDNSLESVTVERGDFRYCCTDDFYLAPFETVIQDTQVMFYTEDDRRNAYSVLVSKNVPDISINIVSPVFSVKSSVKLQITNVGSKKRIVPVKTLLFALMLNPTGQQSQSLPSSVALSQTSLSTSVRHESTCY